jgi:protein-tyrosine phosphatase
MGSQLQAAAGAASSASIACNTTTWQRSVNWSQATADASAMVLVSHVQAQSWIDAALASGGAVLVHCHEGKSRSVTLLLAYLMISRGQTLAAALAHMRAVHPKASPNAGTSPVTPYTSLNHPLAL